MTFKLDIPSVGSISAQSITPPATVDGYRIVLRLQARGIGFWSRKCMNWYSCGSRKITRIVADTYYPTYGDARKADVPWGMPVCEHCYREMVRNYSDDDIVLLLTRPRVSLYKRHACKATTMGGKPCQRDGMHYIVIGGKRRHFCANHSAIHAVYTDVFRTDRKGMRVNITDQQHAFYRAHRWAIR